MKRIYKTKGKEIADHKGRDKSMTYKKVTYC